MSKIQMLDEATIVLANGASIKISECLDGSFNIQINDSAFGEGVRLGIPNEDGITFRYWKSIKEELKDDEAPNLTDEDYIPSVEDEQLPINETDDMSSEPSN